ncbi:metallophosphoesterase [Kosakonia sp. BK9b]
MLIAQLSDIHATAGNDNLQRLRQAVDWLISLQPDMVVLTGDLTDDGWHEGYLAIATELRRLSCPTRILPGNADDKQVMCAALPDFAHRRPTDALHFSEVVAGVPLIGVDVTVSGESGGDIRPHLAWLETALAAYPQPAVIFLHQHLFTSGITPIDSAICLGAEALFPLFSRLAFPPLALCSGHVHRTASAVVAGVPALICGSICPANPLLLEDRPVPPVTDPVTLMIHDVCNGERVSHVVALQAQASPSQ